MNREQMIERAAMAWHDASCPEGSECRSRVLHGQPRSTPVMHMLEAVLDAVLPQVTTVAELEALPVHSVVIDARGGVWENRTEINGTWYGTALDELEPKTLARFAPLTVVWQPEVTR